MNSAALGTASPMPATSAASITQTSSERQNWVLDPFQDGLFIIVAPLIVLAAALWAFARFGVAEATSLIVVAHIVMTVAHHLPTFIRIYGDVDLFKRFKWSFVLGPVVPLTFSTAVLVYINANDYPVEYFLYLYIMLALWDPWHFLRQHYGFMRIYDRPNAAPRRLAANMDLWLCVTWFIYIMSASGAWLPGLLHDMYTSANLAFVLSVSATGIDALANLAAYAAIAMSIAYGGYLAWCWRQGFYVSWAKLALFAITFGVMYLTYTPNRWILAIEPGWTFKVGFAAVGIVHMTQYLAIVWRYNRSLAANPARSRAGVFRRWHGVSNGTIAWLLGAAYVAICLFYGDAITTKHEGRWLMSALLAIGFTSTLLHYYFDGFIWKVRHQQNREALSMTSEKNPEASGGSWWTSAKQMTASKMLVRQLLYFGLPMMLLTVGAVAAWKSPSDSYVQHMYRAQTLSQQGLQNEAEIEARLAYAAMNKQLPFAKKMAELEATAARQAELAFLIYNQSLYQHIVLPQLAGSSIDAQLVNAYRERVLEAVQMMDGALENGGSVGHSSRERLSVDEARAVLESWRKQLREL